MKRIHLKFLSFILLLVFLLSDFRLFSIYATASTESEESTTASISLKWMDPPGTLTGNAVDYTPPDQYSMTMPMELTFSLGNISRVEAGQVEIRIPKSIFRDRQGNLTGNIKLPLPLKPGTSEVTSFQYYSDTESDDIIITNFEPILNTVLFKVDIEYNGSPLNIRDGFVNDSIVATAKIKPTDQETVEISSDTLSVCIHTWAKINNVTKYDHRSYGSWGYTWGTEPENSEKYFYQIWGLNVKCAYTQPYTLKVTDELSDGFEFIGWKRTNYPMNTPEGPFTIGSYEEFSSRNFTPSWIIVRKEKPPAGQTINYTNAFSITLHGVDGATDQGHATASGKYTTPIPPEDYEYPGDRNFLSKQEKYYYLFYNNAIINILEKDMPIKISYDLSADGSNWNKVNDPITGELSTRSCLIELSDNEFMLENQLLNTGDYSINSFSIRFSVYKEWIEDNEKQMQLKSSPPLNIYYKTRNSSDWLLVYTITKNADGTFTFKTSSGDTFVKNNCSNSLPENTINIKIAAETNLQGYILDVTTNITLLPSNHVKSIINNKEEAALTNKAILTVTDDKGNKQLRTATYRKVLTREEITGSLKKYCSKLNSDTTLGVENYYYSVSVNSGMYYGDSFITPAQLLDKKIYEPLQNGIFYDLLPIGVSADISSIKMEIQTAQSMKVISKSEYKIFTTDNWRNTGRTMLEIRFDLLDSNYYIYDQINEKLIRSQLRISFTISNPWNNIIDNGPMFTNRVACYAEEGKLYGETYPDDPTQKYPDDLIWEKFYDLNNDGNISNNELVQYAQNTTNQGALIAAQYGFSKKVKSISDTVFSQLTQINAASRYVYQLRFMTQKKASARGIIMYDVLENYYYNDEFWKGRLEYIDVSHPTSKGINPIVYYSTKDNLKPYSNSADANLSDASVWSTVKPNDLSTVKAIAVDLRTDKNSNPYVLNPEESVYVNIGMIAPGSYDENSATDSHAFNGGIIKANVTNQDTNITNTITELCIPTDVTLVKSSIGINKISDPVTGTKILPASLKEDGKLSYTLSVINNSSSETFRDIVLEDVIPNQLSIETDNLKFYYGNNAANAELLKETGSIRYKLNSDNKLVFNIDMIEANGIINFVIPTYATKYSYLIENVAQITKVNNVSTNIQSETTYHMFLPYSSLPDSGDNSNMILNLFGFLFIIKGSVLYLYLITRRMDK